MIALVYDTETTGLWYNRLKDISKQPYIVEFFGMVVDFEADKILDKFYSYFKPSTSMSKEAEKVTGLSDAFLKDYELFEKKIDEVDKLFQVDNIVGQNIMFDIQMTKFEYFRSGRELDLSNKNIYDTIEATEYELGHRQNLTTLHERKLGTSFSGAHTAEEDVMATYRVARELYINGEL